MIIKKWRGGAVGIGELKSKLSGYVTEVHSGEQIIITDHGEEVAMMVPISRERRVVKSMVESGMAQWSGEKPKGLEGVNIKGHPLSDTILEERQ